jgi:hypothetical protein
MSRWRTCVPTSRSIARAGRETVVYVANIYKYYLSYSLLERQLRTREQVRGATP